MLGLGIFIPSMAVAIRRDHGDIRDPGQRRSEHPDAGRLTTVVITDQNLHARRIALCPEERILTNAAPEHKAPGLARLQARANVARVPA